VPNNFQDFPFLANGSGPYAGGVLGQLDPWPGAVAPAIPNCASGSAVFTPVADAGPNQTAKRGDVVTLNGGNSRDTTTPTAMPLTYTWTQVGADGVAVTDPSQLMAPVAAPNQPPPALATPQDLPTVSFVIDTFADGKNIPDGTVLTFRLDASNCGWWSWEGSCATSSATMTVTVVKKPTPTDTLTAVTAIWRAKRSRLDVNASTTDASAVLTVLGFGVMGPALPVAPGVPAPATDRSYTQVGVNPAPAEITVRSSLGAIVTVPVTVRP